MKNLTNYSDQFILGLMEDCNISPHRATANVQLNMQSDGTLVECLNIWQEMPGQLGWDVIVQLVFSEEKRFIDFCDEMHITTRWEYDTMEEFYQLEPTPDPVHDEELFIDELLAEDYYAELQQEYEETIHSLRYC